jgi:hypothetical protein
MAQEDLRSSYDKNTEDMKGTFENKTNKMSKNYSNQKSKLEEDNQVSNQTYSDKTKEIIANRQERFKNELKKNSDRFDQDRNEMKTDFSEKLSNLSTSYKKSTEENDRFHNQAQKTMGERYTKANKNYKQDFDKKIDDLVAKSKNDFVDNKLESHKSLVEQDKANQENLQNLRSSNQEQKFREINRLRNDNENLRTSFSQERDSMNEQQAARIDDVLKLKNIESEEGQKNFSNLQQEIREKNLHDEEKTKNAHLEESKILEKRYNDDLRNIQHMANQKIQGGNEVNTLKDENKQLVAGFENRLQAAHDESQKLQSMSTEKEKKIDDVYREQLKNLKISNGEELQKKESDLTVQHKGTLQTLKERNDDVIDRYKTEVARTKYDGEDRLGKANSKSKKELDQQRVSFGKFINNVNEKKMEEVNSIKNDFLKNKTNFIEKSKKDMSEEKLQMKEGFNHQIGVKEELFERKLSEMEKQTNKIIENYEARMNQLARKTEKDVEMMKSTDEARRIKEEQARKIAFESQEQNHQMEVGNLRNKYETMIGKDRAISELQTNQIVQKYEDQLERERSEHQKDLSLRLSESQSQFERLFKSSELEKETLRNQYEQRMENMKNSALIQGNSKKS